MGSKKFFEICLVYAGLGERLSPLPFKQKITGSNPVAGRHHYSNLHAVMLSEITDGVFENIKK